MLPMMVASHPSRAELSELIVRGLRLAGMLSLAAGVVFFVAANWDAIGVLGRFALLQGLLAGSVAMALWRPPPHTVGRFGLLGSFVVTGALLALYGQTYQTGADLYELFLSWAALGLPFVVAARWPVVSAAWVLVLNVALALYCGWRPSSGLLWALLDGFGLRFSQLLLVPVAVNLLLWSACEALRGTRFAGVAPAWLARFVLACAIASATWAGAFAIVGDDSADPVVLLVVIAVLGGVGIHAYRRHADVFPLALVAGSVIILGAVAIARRAGLGSSGSGILFVLALWLIASSTLAGRLLMGLVRSWREGPAPEAAAPDRPWYIGTVLGISGWLAGLFALGFVWMLFSPSGIGEISLVALILLAAAFGLYAVDRESAFFDQLALALSIAGQVAFVAAATELTKSLAGIAALVAVMQCVLVLAMPNRLARLLATFFACVAWALAIRFAWWGETFNADRGSVALGPALAGWAVIWIPVMAIAFALANTEAKWTARLRPLLGPVLSGLLLALALGTLVSEPIETLVLWGSETTGRTNWLVIWPLLAVGAALLAVVAAFLVRRHALLGVAIAGALLHVMHFYYLLGASLLVKSCIMLGVGVVLLAGSMLLAPRTPRAGEVPA
ncbi:MAG TPA: DUF4401 domain-containing protein [Steroidobacteraceae bacterium]|nr:DUF4401 domain-containing protein [Steroidobacteraceae bacterium]